MIECRGLSVPACDDGAAQKKCLPRLLCVNLDTDCHDPVRIACCQVLCGRKGLNMNRSVEVRAIALQISSNLHDRMAEVRKLREMVRSAEAANLGQEPIHPAAAAHPIDNKTRV